MISDYIPSSNQQLDLLPTNSGVSTDYHSLCSVVICLLCLAHCRYILVFIALSLPLPLSLYHFPLSLSPPSLPLSPSLSPSTLPFSLSLYHFPPLFLTLSLLNSIQAPFTFVNLCIFTKYIQIELIACTLRNLIIGSPCLCYAHLGKRLDNI